MRLIPLLSPTMKFLFDLLPVILFFIAFKVYGIFVATAVAIIASVLQVAYVYFKYKKVEKTHLITLALIVILGGLTLILHDETFIKWKPTIVNWGFALAFLGSHFIGKKPIIQRMMDNAIKLPNPIWTKLSFLWIIFFIFSGLINIYVAFNYDTDTWVNFKLFGLMGLTLVFIVAQGFYISRYILPDENNETALKKVTDEELETLSSIEMDAVAHNDEQDKTKKTTKEF